VDSVNPVVDGVTTGSYGKMGSVSDDTRSRLVVGALRLLREKGLDAVTLRAVGDLSGVLRSVGATQENVVKQTILVAKGQDIRAGYAAAQRVWRAHPIAIAVHIVDGFGISGALVGIEAVCALGE
jgi:enamine deaminase RidA (YjgF/YER057c/UK114 family)